MSTPRRPKVEPVLSFTRPLAKNLPHLILRSQHPNPPTFTNPQRRPRRLLPNTLDGGCIDVNGERVGFLVQCGEGGLCDARRATGVGGGCELGRLAWW